MESRGTYMRYGAFGLVEVLGDANAVLVVDQMLLYLSAEVYRR